MCMHTYVRVRHCAHTRARERENAPAHPDRRWTTERWPDGADQHSFAVSIRARTHKLFAPERTESRERSATFGPFSPFSSASFFPTALRAALSTPPCIWCVRGVGVCVCVCVCVCARAHEYTYHVCVCMCVRASARPRMAVCMNVRILWCVVVGVYWSSNHVCVCVIVCVCVCVAVCMNAR